MEDMNGTAKIIGALFIGALTGAALGVLFAPEKGSKTRSNIVDGAKDLASELKKKMKEEAHNLRKKAEELEDMAKEKTEDVLNDIKDKAEETAKAK